MINKTQGSRLIAFGRRSAAALCLIFLLSAFTSCEKPVVYTMHTVEAPESKVPNVSIVDLNYPERLGDYPKASYLTDAVSAAAEFDRYGFSEDVKKTYGEDWFQSSGLVMVLLSTNSSYGYTVTDMDVSKDLIHVYIQEIKPSGAFDLLKNRAVLIGIAKTEVSADAEVKAEIETVDEGQ